jgi:hypothetical protein
LHLFEAQSYSSSGALLSYGDEVSGKGGRRGKIWDKKEG